MKDFNVYIKKDWLNDFFWLRFAKKFFGFDKVIKIRETDFPKLLKEVGFFSSTSEARRAGYKGEIPLGWNEYKTNSGKYLAIFNPTQGYFQ